MKNLAPGMDIRRRVPWARAALVLIVLIAFALRVYRLGAQAIWWDESLSVYRATRDLTTILSNIILIQNVITVDTLPPLYFVFLHFLVRAFGTTEFAFRFFSLIASTATIPLLYGLARRWFSSEIGLIAALLGALSPFYVWYAQEARPYALVLFFSTLAVYALARAFDPRRRNLGTSSKIWAAVYLLAAIAALYTHYITVFLIPFHFVLIAAMVWQRPRARGWVLLPALALASIVFLLPMIRSSAAGNASTGPFFVPLDMMLRDLLNSFSVGITVDFAQVVWIDAVLCVLFIIGIVLPRRGFRISSSIYLAAFILVPVLGVEVASFVRPLYQNSRYLIALSPAFYLGVAAGIVALAQRWRVLALPALAVFLIGATLSLYNLYFDPHYGKDDHRAWASFLHERWRPGDVLILDSPHTEELYRYYAGDLSPLVTLPVLRGDGKDSPEADLAAVRYALAQSTRIWFLEMDVAFDDPRQRIQTLLNQEGVLLDRSLFPATSTEIVLSLYVPALPVANAADIPHPLDVEFTGHLRLRGYDAPSSISAGQRGAVRLFWQVDEPVGENYAVSLRMVDETGTALAQWDTVPLGNRAGTETWQPQIIMTDVHDLPIAPDTRPGTYRLQIVPYHAATGNALGEGVILAEIQVTPLPTLGTKSASGQ